MHGSNAEERGAPHPSRASACCKAWLGVLSPFHDFFAYVTPSCARALAPRAHAPSGATRARTVCAQVSYLEIYNEQFRDLLDHRFAFNKQVLSVCAWCLRRSSMCAQPQQARSVTESKERADQERHTASVGPCFCCTASVGPCFCVHGDC